MVKAKYSRNCAVEPPTPPIHKTSWVSLLLDIVWLNVILVPQIALAIYRRIFPKLKSLKGQVALITGGGRGLGRGLALAFAEEGCRVAVADVNLASAQDTAEEICRSGGQAKAYFCNVAKVEDVKQLRTAVTKDLGPVDLLVHNAGIIFFKSLEDSTEEEITRVMIVNLNSHFWMAKEFLPSMRERNSGHIVAISSLASYGGDADMTAYVASKFGVKGFMECVRAELNRIPGNNIKTTTVCPYSINSSPELAKQFDLRIPAMSIDEAVQATVKGVKREEVLFTIPEFSHYAAHFTRLLPQNWYDMGSKVFYMTVKPANEEEVATTKDLGKRKLPSKSV